MNSKNLYVTSYKNNRLENDEKQVVEKIQIDFTAVHGTEVSQKNQADFAATFFFLLLFCFLDPHCFP